MRPCEGAQTELTHSGIVPIITPETIKKNKKKTEQEEKKKKKKEQEKKSSSDDTSLKGMATPDTADHNNHTVSGAEEGVSEQMHCIIEPEVPTHCSKILFYPKHEVLEVS